MNKLKTRAANQLNEIIKEIAAEEGLTFKKTERVIFSIFELIAEDMRKGNLKGTRIIHLGRFLVKPYNIHKYLNHLNQKNNGDNTEDEG